MSERIYKSSIRSSADLSTNRNKQNKYLKADSFAREVCNVWNSKVQWSL